MSKAKGLGRGLDALLGADSAPSDALTTLPVGRIRPGRYQPRTRMDEQSLNELAAQYQVHPTQINAWKKKALEEEKTIWGYTAGDWMKKKI